MPIIINRKLFKDKLSDKVVGEMIEEVKKIPEPEISSDEMLSCDKQEIGLCLQRESFYLDQFYATSEIKYLGSKNVISCLVAYIHSETDHLVIHFDNTNNIDLTGLIKRFNSKQGIKVSLVGGIPSKQSEQTLNNIVKNIFEAANALAINIEITHQKVIENNKFSPEDKPAFIFNKIIEKADITFRRLFDRPLDEQYILGKKVSDLRNKSVECTPKLQLMAAMLSQAKEAFDTADKHKISMLDALFKKDIKDEKEFLAILDLMFSRQGFELLDLGYQKNALYGDSKLRDFVFDINTGKMFIISSQTKTPNEDIRAVSIYDRHQTASYLLCYDGSKGAYFIPDLSENFVRGCQKIMPLLHSTTFLDKSAISTHFEIVLSIPETNKLMKFIRSMSEKKPTVSTFFTPSITSTAQTYQPNEVSNQNLLLIQELTGIPFKGRLRYYPEYTVDALVQCATEKEALKIKENLDEVFLNSLVIKYENEFAVCIPAINVGHYAQEIYEKKKYLGV
ncbi:MAG: hypothetical protein P4L79_02490 [Legionella sp.]|uniref:hypothetical protein n=1 Tax=Legionella sp. TaxID=459 RepID=UPI00284B6B11|nr:hypothetical protein [Legionella sp.]